MIGLLAKGLTTQDLVAKLGVKKPRGAELHPFCPQETWGADTSRIGGMGEGSRTVQAQVVEAGGAVRAESEDAGVLRINVKRYIRVVPLALDTIER